jgi:hypothetical protein
LIEIFLVKYGRRWRALILDLIENKKIISHNTTPSNSPFPRGRTPFSPPWKEELGEVGIGNLRHDLR